MLPRLSSVERMLSLRLVCVLRTYPVEGKKGLPVLGWVLFRLHRFQLSLFELSSEVSGSTLGTFQGLYVGIFHLHYLITFKLI